MSVTAAGSGGGGTAGRSDARWTGAQSGARSPGARRLGARPGARWCGSALLAAALTAAAAVAVSVLGLGGGAGFAGGVAPASAHDFLVSTSPAADTTVTDPLAEVSLTFNEPPLTDLQAGIAVEVRDPAGASASGALSIVNATLSVPFTPTSTGGYTVLWQTVSSDGHPVSGEYAFDYQGPVSSTPTPTATASPAESDAALPSSAAAASSSSPPGTPVAGSASDDGGDGGVQLPLVLAASVGSLVVVGAVVVVIVLTMRRRRA